MIQTFKNKALERLLREGNAKGIPTKLEKRTRARLEVIDTAIIIDDIRIPG
jgi:proteic killer suppression protein